MCATSTAAELDTVTWNTRPSAAATCSSPTTLSITSGGTKVYDITRMVQAWKQQLPGNENCTVRPNPALP